MASDAGPSEAGADRRGQVQPPEYSRGGDTPSNTDTPHTVGYNGAHVALAR